MRALLAFSTLAVFLCLGCTSETDPQPDAESGGEAVTAASVEIGCAMCIFNQDGVDTCTPAVKMGDKVLLLEGYEPESEHALCNASKKAVVDGRIQGNTLMVTSVKLEE